ncbi:N-6 DNA methylase [Clostridium aromativorans]|uniref:N-6 DNA methylase n=1 Tax=Clostridium aromativorans TaxID=2836848 RepID=UPI002DD89207|nr:N-6 DNA methylase [Clostridium aromativorans]
MGLLESSQKAKNEVISKTYYIKRFLGQFALYNNMTLNNAHVASIEEIRENEFNLNIPRYVDTFEEAPIDLEEVNNQLEQDNKEIA